MAQLSAESCLYPEGLQHGVAMLLLRVVLAWQVQAAQCLSLPVRALGQLLVVLCCWKLAVAKATWPRPERSHLLVVPARLGTVLEELCAFSAAPQLPALVATLVS